MNTKKYFKNADNNWSELKWAIKCPVNNGLINCQGPMDHRGPHWQYNELGYLLIWTEKDPKAKIIKPTDQAYIHPQNAPSYTSIREELEIDNEALIGALNIINGQKSIEHK